MKATLKYLFLISQCHRPLLYSFVPTSYSHIHINKKAELCNSLETLGRMEGKRKSLADNSLCPLALLLPSPSPHLPLHLVSFNVLHLRPGNS